jgi:hypothetical protein
MTLVIILRRKYVRAKPERYGYHHPIFIIEARSERFGSTLRMKYLKLLLCQARKQDVSASRCRYCPLKASVTVRPILSLLERQALVPSRNEVEKINCGSAFVGVLGGCKCLSPCIADDHQDDVDSSGHCGQARSIRATLVCV